MLNLIPKEKSKYENKISNAKLLIAWWMIVLTNNTSLADSQKTNFRKWMSQSKRIYELYHISDSEYYISYSLLKTQIQRKP